MIRSILKVAAAFTLLAGLALASNLLAGPAHAGGCLKKSFFGCSIKAPGVKYKGVLKPKTIRVKICHRTWHLLNQPRWWGMTLRHGSWQKNIREVHSKCTWQNVVPGSVVKNFHNCRGGVGRWYSTKPLRRASATYWVG